MRCFLGQGDCSANPGEENVVEEDTRHTIFQLRVSIRCSALSKVIRSFLDCAEGDSQAFPTRDQGLNLL